VILYLLRHAATQANKDGLILGALDPPALPEALSSFASSSRILVDKGIRRVFSSPLVRAAEAAAILARILGVPCDILPGLAELSAGVYEGRRRRDILPPDRPLRRNWTDRPAGGESMADAASRVAVALDGIRNALVRGPVAVVGHAVVNRVLLMLLLGRQDDALFGFIQPHGTVVAVSETDGIVRLAPDASAGNDLPGPRAQT
jgi:broad specificity phosphatase PhoE